MFFIAEYTLYILIVYIIVRAIFSKEVIRARIIFIFSVVSCLISEIIGKIAGMFISHPQPFATLANVNLLKEAEVNNSFPSDHTILVFSICMILFLGSQSKNRFLILLIPIMVGISRIWLGVHYPSDILAGALIAIVVSITVYSLFAQKFNDFLTKKLHQTNNS